MEFCEDWKMTISTDLMNAILAMDSYNRGYSLGIYGQDAVMLDNMAVAE